MILIMVDYSDLINVFIDFLPPSIPLSFFSGASCRIVVPAALPAEMVNFGTKILEGFNKYFWTSYHPNSGLEQKF